jgi:hypothetical protein
MDAPTRGPTDLLSGDKRGQPGNLTNLEKRPDREKLPNLGNREHGLTWDNGTNGGNEPTWDWTANRENKLTGESGPQPGNHLTWDLDL